MCCVKRRRVEDFVRCTDNRSIPGTYGFFSRNRDNKGNRGKKKKIPYGGFRGQNLVRNTRTDYADMGKIVREPSIHILGEQINDFSGPFFGTMLDLCWTIIGLFCTNINIC